LCFLFVFYGGRRQVESGGCQDKQGCKNLEYFVSLSMLVYEKLGYRYQWENPKIGCYISEASGFQIWKYFHFLDRLSVA
jgi:hypothetical protein